ncbi:MAG: hypothetical protein J6P61_03505 [Erysipelotrichaceae bacterium]|nr:hypothetical protein [Erysipelotrichaceae bacterium]
MLNVNKKALIERIKEAAPHASEKWYDNYAERLITTIDDTLITNVEEWINHQPLSPIGVGDKKYTINLVLSMRGNNDFLSALEDLNDYMLHGSAYEMRLWRAKR